MTTLRRLVMAGLVAVALLSGCGGGAAPAGTSAPAAATPATGATTPATNGGDAYPSGYPAGYPEPTTATAP